MGAENTELLAAENENNNGPYGSFVHPEYATATDYGDTYKDDDTVDNKIHYIYWFLLVGAIFFEVAGTTMMKLSDGLTQLLPSLGIFLFYAISFILMPLSLKGIELSTAYAIWSGVGTTLTCLIG
jgi:small multidrug resistance pump